MNCMKIKGITITLIDKVQTGVDAFNHPVYEDQEIHVDNVLVAPASSTDIPEDIDLQGKKIVYTLAIPKGDTHTWEDRKVRFFGQTFHVCTVPVGGIESMIPLSWKKKVMVERYE